MKIKLLFSIKLLVLLSFQTIVSQTPPPPNGQMWVSVPELTDEFIGNTIDASKWDDLHPHWNGRPPSRFKRENTTVGGGYLRLKSTLLRDPSTVNNPLSDIWVNSASCVSKNKSARPGYYYEARIKASSLSMTSAFWFRVGNYSEIDVIEHIGNPSREDRQHDLPYEFNSNTHYYGPHAGLPPKPNVWRMPVRGRDGFHTYAVWWKNPNLLIFYWDGQEVMRTVPRVPYAENLKMVFDTEVFPFAQAGIPSIGLPTVENLNNDNMNTMLVDWVRTYKLEADDGTNAPDTVALDNPDLEIEPLQSYNFNVMYSTTSNNREVLVSFWKGNTWLGAGTANVEPGENQIQQVTVNLNALPEPGTDYVYKYHIRPRGTDYTQATDEGQVVNVIVSDVLGVNDNNLKVFKMYPNPISKVLNLKEIETGKSITIYDYTGRKLMHAISVDDNATLNVSNLQSGAYFVKIKGYQVKRLIVK